MSSTPVDPQQAAPDPSESCAVIPPVGPMVIDPNLYDPEASAQRGAHEAEEGVQADRAGTASGLGPTLAQARRGLYTLLLSHTLIDIYPIFFTSLMLVLRERLTLSEWQVAAVFMASPIFSGLGQPVFAWLTDKYDSRLAGPGGVALGALCIGSIGFAQNFWQLLALQIVGVIGTGMFHPVGTAVAGQAGTRVVSSKGPRSNGRAVAIGLFIAAGMVGQSVGPIIATRTTEHFGMPALAWLIAPTLIIACVLHAMIRRIPHRHQNHRAIGGSVPADEARLRRRTVGILTVQNCLRFTANVGMFVMFNVWADSVIRGSAAAQRAAEAAILKAQAAGLDAAAIVEAGNKAIATQGSHLAANLSASMTIGMGIGVFSAGRLFQPGGEHRPLLVMSMIGAAAMAALGPVGALIARSGDFGFIAMLPMYLCAATAPVGFFATFPLATSLAQRLLPGHTSLVSSLMMGVGWAASSLATPLAMLFFGGVTLSAAAALPATRINAGFYGFASLLVLAGLLSLALPRWLLGKVASER